MVKHLLHPLHTALSVALLQPQQLSVDEVPLPPAFWINDTVGVTWHTLVLKDVQRSWGHIYTEQVFVSLDAGVRPAPSQAECRQGPGRHHSTSKSFCQSGQLGIRLVRYLRAWVLLPTCVGQISAASFARASRLGFRGQLLASRVVPGRFQHKGPSECVLQHEASRRR